MTTVYAYPGWVRTDALEEGEGEVVTDSAGPPLEVARSYLGAPYLWGGMTEAGIDCSGLVHMAYRRTGRLVPRDAHDQDAAAIPSTNLRRATWWPTAIRSTTWRSGSATVRSSMRRAVRASDCVVAELEPVALKQRRRGFRRL